MLDGPVFPDFPEPNGAPSGPRKESSTDMVQLQSDVERLLIVTEALWTILKEKQGLDEQELVRQMVIIDMRDGKLDGRVAATAPRKCGKCQRTLYKHRLKCLYCGEPQVPEPFQR
jgi:hypothetical protein